MLLMMICMFVLFYIFATHDFLSQPPNKQQLRAICIGNSIKVFLRMRLQYYFIQKDWTCMFSRISSTDNTSCHQNLRNNGMYMYSDHRSNPNE